MVTLLPGRRGASKLGCLFSLVFFVGAILYGSQIGRIYWRYYAFNDDMKQAALFARSRSNEAIVRELRASAEQLGLPTEAQRIKVLRTVGASVRITISAEYHEQIRLPVGDPVTLTFRPRAEWTF